MRGQRAGSVILRPPMLLDARKTIPTVERAYAWYGRRLLRRAFARLWIGGTGTLGGEAPSIAFVNHSAWWDPVLAVHLSHDLFRRDGYGLMEGAQLQRYPFFRRVGCFGATTDALPDVRGVLAHATSLLRGGPRRTLWIFPQGELVPARAPLVFRSGLARFARAVPEAALVPVAVRYEHRGEERPEVFVRVGEPASAARGESIGALTHRLEHRLRAELALLDAELAATRPPEAPAGYTTALSGRRSVSALYERTFGRWGGRARAPTPPAPPVVSLVRVEESARDARDPDAMDR